MGQQFPFHLREKVSILSGLEVLELNANMSSKIFPSIKLKWKQKEKKKR